MTGGYDAGYRACDCFWGSEPASGLLELARLVDFKGFKVLDAGCGEGKNTAYLLGRGASVRSIDISPYAIANAHRAWPNVPIDQWEVGDIRRQDFTGNVFDLVLAYGVLHCLHDESDVQTVVARLNSATRPGGFHVVCSFNSRLQELEAHPGFAPCLLTHDFFVRMYKDWDLLLASDSDLVETHPHNGIRHRHSLTRIIARKRLFT